MKERWKIKEIARKNMCKFYGPCMGVCILAAILQILFSFLFVFSFLVPVISVSLYGLFVSIYIDYDVSASDWVGFELFHNFFRKLGGYLWESLFLFLWSLLFTIPGIVKSYAYSMTPYILADCPHVKARDALKISIRMTEGHKWELFVTKLSFIGWMLLSLFTGGILYIFYVFPYMQTTMAGYYVELKHNAIERGIVTAEEFEGGAARLAA